MISRIPLILALTLVSMTIPTGMSSFDAESNGSVIVEEAYFGFEGSEYSFRWTMEEVATSLECDLYEICTWIDIKGPTCQTEILVTLEFYDENDVYVDAGVDVLPEQGMRELNALEVGTNLEIEFDSFLLVFVECSSGLPTGVAEI